MDLKKIKKLIELLEESNLSEIEIKEQDYTVKLVRSNLNNDLNNLLPQYMNAGLQNFPTLTIPVNGNHHTGAATVGMAGMAANLGATGAGLATGVSGMAGNFAPFTSEATSAELKVSQTPRKQICSPMVGTFYCSPAPGAKAFVELGQSVKAGDNVCIIEAMKMMNQITAETAGTIVNMLVNDGDPVEYGQVLFELE